MRTVLRLIPTAVMAIVATTAIALAAGPLLGAWQLAPIVSPSMEPNISTGSLAVTRPTSISDLAVGDIAVFQAPVGDRAITVHRVIEIRRDGSSTAIRTQGDANANPDPWVAMIDSDLVWRLDRSVPGLGTPLMVLQSRQVRVTTIAALAAALVVAGLRFIWGPDWWHDHTPVGAAAIAVVLVMSLGSAAAAGAEFTHRAAAASSVSTAATSTVMPPADLIAAPECSLLERSIRLRWTAPPKNSNTGYEVQRAIDSAPFDVIATLSNRKATTYLDDQVPTDTLDLESQIRYRVITLALPWRSDPSNVATVDAREILELVCL